MVNRTAAFMVIYANGCFYAVIHRVFQREPVCIILRLTSILMRFASSIQMVKGERLRVNCSCDLVFQTYLKKMQSTKDKQVSKKKEKKNPMLFH